MSASGRIALRVAVLAYLGLLLAAPVSLIFYRTFEHGIQPVWAALSNHDAAHALWLTVVIAAIAVPLNTLFGVVCALAVVRYRVPGFGVVNTLVDLPLALSPVVVGLALFLLYGRGDAVGDWLGSHGIQVLFSLPGMLLATIFVSLPFVVREVVPVLREIGVEQEEAAVTLGASAFQTFRRVTLPSIRWAVTYGVVLTTARALGEFGAVSVVSGQIQGRTETLTLYVQRSYENFDPVGAYAGATVLAALAVCTLVAMTVLQRKGEAR
jgi:sulfate transport system permease protein